MSGGGTRKIQRMKCVNVVVESMFDWLQEEARTLMYASNDRPSIHLYIIMNRASPSMSPQCCTFSHSALSLITVRLLTMIRTC
jgi:hypothetical protein